jgi:4-amino-4-deoxy-L-arabinose transferase-like glycosyltransferase
MDRTVTENQELVLSPNAAFRMAQSAGEYVRNTEDIGEACRRWEFVAVFVLTTILYFVRLGARALWASEFRWAEVAREMMLTGNYFWPTINGKVYFDKPLGSYWLVVASTWITGTLNETAIRLPSAIAGVLAVVMLALLGRHLYNLRTGIIAGFVLATSFGFAFWARNASADVETVAGVLAVLLIFARNSRNAGWWVIAMWSIMALTSLMKGLLGFVLPLLVMSSFSCTANGWQELALHLGHGPLSTRLRWLTEQNRWFFNRYTIAAFPLAVVLYLLPFAVSVFVTGSAKGLYMVYRENFERYFAPFDHRGPVYLYAYAIFLLMAPWSLFLPAAIVQAHSSIDEAGPASRAGKSKFASSNRFTLAFFWAIVIFFTLSGSRRSYYILPALPAAALMVARLFAVNERTIGKLVRILLTIGLWSAGVLVIGAGFALTPARALLPYPYSLLPALPAETIFALGWIISLATMVYACISYSRERMLLSSAVTSYLFLSYLFFAAMPAGDKWRGEKQFATTTRQLIGTHDNELAAFRTQPPVFYLGLAHPIPEYDSPSELGSAIRAGHLRWLIVRRRDIRGINVQARQAAAEPVYPWDPRQHRENSLVLMKLGG